MQEQARFGVVRLLLDVASDRRAMHKAGHVLQVIQSSSSNAAASIAVEEPDGKTFPIRDGFGWQHSPFTRLFLSHAAQPGEWMDVLIGGDPGQARPELFRAFSVTNASKVTIEGQSGSVAVDATIAGQLADVVTVEGANVLSASEPMVLGLGVFQAFKTTGSAVAILYTVPAGKKLWIRRARLWASTASAPAHASITVGGVPVAGASSSLTFGSLDVFQNYVIPAGGELRMNNNPGAGDAHLSMWSELRDA